MALIDIVNAIKLQLSASILPEARWHIVVIYTLVLILLTLRLYTGEPLRNIVFDTSQYLSNEYYETEYYTVSTVGGTGRPLSLISTLAMNVLPLIFPILISTIFNRISGHHAQQTVN